MLDRVPGAERLVDERKLRGAKSTMDVDRSPPAETDRFLALGDRRTQRAFDDALPGALQAGEVLLARRHLHGQTHLHLWDGVLRHRSFLSCSTKLARYFWHDEPSIPFPGDLQADLQVHPAMCHLLEQTSSKAMWRNDLTFWSLFYLFAYSSRVVCPEKLYGDCQDKYTDDSFQQERRAGAVRIETD